MLRNWTLDVTTTDDPSTPVTVPISPRVILDFERHHKIGLVAAFSDDMKLEQLFHLAWFAMHRAGHTLPVFETWCEQLIDVELNVESADPLGGVALATS